MKNGVRRREPERSEMAQQSLPLRHSKIKGERTRAEGCSGLLRIRSCRPEASEVERNETSVARGCRLVRDWSEGAWPAAAHRD
jgi:hypothetical protein